MFKTNTVKMDNALSDPTAHKYMFYKDVPQADNLIVFLKYMKKNESKLQLDFYSYLYPQDWGFESGAGALFHLTENDGSGNMIDTVRYLVGINSQFVYKDIFVPFESGSTRMYFQLTYLGSPANEGDVYFEIYPDRFAHRAIY